MDIEIVQASRTAMGIWMIWYKHNKSDKPHCQAIPEIVFQRRAEEYNTTNLDLIIEILLREFYVKDKFNPDVHIDGTTVHNEHHAKIKEHVKVRLPTTKLTP